MFRAPGGIRTWLATLAVAASTLLVAPTAAHASGAGTLAADVNAARASAGLRTLGYDGSLSAVAQSWANHMASHDQLAHNPSTPSQIRSGWSAWGENVGYTTTGSASALHAAFMASSEHRANILNRSFTSIGVGWATRNGHTYVAEVFAAYPRAAAKPSGTSRPGSGSATGSSAQASSTARSSSSSGAAEAPPAGSTTSRTTTPPTTTRAPAPQIVHPDGLVRGDTGPKVRAMQVRLGVHGHPVRADGAFGPITDRAVRAFQGDARLTVDGIVGKKTAAALAKPAPKKATPPAQKTTPAQKPAAPTRAPATPDAAALLPLSRQQEAGRSDLSRTPLAQLSPTTSRSAFATPVAFTAVPTTTTAASSDGEPGPSTAAVLGSLLALTVLVGAAGAWTVRRRRAA